MLNAACTAPPANRLRSIGPVMTISFAANAISLPTGIAKCGPKSVPLALFSQSDMTPNTTLADFLTPPLGAHPFSTMRASLRRQSSEELDDCVAHGGQSWLRRRAVDSFFSASLLRDGGAGGRRKRSLS